MFDTMSAFLSGVLSGRFPDTLRTIRIFPFCVRSAIFCVRHAYALRASAIFACSMLAHCLRSVFCVVSAWALRGCSSPRRPVPPHTQPIPLFFALLLRYFCVIRKKGFMPFMIQAGAARRTVLARTKAASKRSTASGSSCEIPPVRRHGSAARRILPAGSPAEGSTFRRACIRYGFPEAHTDPAHYRNSPVPRISRHSRNGSKLNIVPFRPSGPCVGSFVPFDSVTAFCLCISCSYNWSRYDNLPGFSFGGDSHRRFDSQFAG